MEGWKLYYSIYEILDGISEIFLTKGIEHRICYEYIKISTHKCYATKSFQIMIGKKPVVDPYFI